MTDKEVTNSETEEEEEEQMNVEKDFQDGFVKPEEIADIDLFKSCLALQRSNELPLREGVIRIFTLFGCWFQVYCKTSNRTKQLESGTRKVVQISHTTGTATIIFVNLRSQ